MKKTLFTITCITFVLSVIICTSLVYTLSRYSRTTTDSKDCAVIFGAAVWRENIPSHALYDRTMTGIDLYNDHLVTCLIISGGPSTFGTHEVDVMHDIALQGGVDPANIVRDPNGLNTRATIANLPADTSFIFVSNDFHLGRIALLAHRYDIKDFTLHRATYYNGRYNKEPYFLLREVIGTIYYFFHIDSVL